MTDAIAKVYQDAHRLNVIWESDCPFCQFHNTVSLPRRMAPGSHLGISAWRCDECREWYTTKFDLDFAQRIRAGPQQAATTPDVFGGEHAFAPRRGPYHPWVSNPNDYPPR